MKTQSSHLCGSLLALVVAASSALFADTPANSLTPAVAKVKLLDKPASGVVYDRVKELRSKADPSEQLDEAMSGMTTKGTAVTPRIPECFPAEPRDLFWKMDWVSAGAGKPLQPLNFDTNGDGKIDNAERNAIRGRNTWLLWGGGNEGFWNWLAQDGYGITDFLVLLDSRRRDDRFVRTGVINQPGFASNVDPSKKILGLYIDLPKSSGSQLLTPPSWDTGARVPGRPTNHSEYAWVETDPSDPDKEVLLQQSSLFKPGDLALWEDTVRKLAAIGDGVDYSVYGFPTGIFGLRLFLNPDFFGSGDYAEKARAYWKERVTSSNSDAYYSDPKVTKDPKLVRPFRISVSCGFCHIGPHPLNPPADREHPEWENLSSNIGAQYWKPQPAFGNLQDGNSVLFHFLASQQPGTVDTSLVSTDHINNANTMNAVFDINARLGRALLNPPELQSPANVAMKSIEDAGLPVKHDGTDWRHTPRVLVDGADSIGAFGALARVYLNIGTFWNQWSTCHNPLIGFIKQRPFSIMTCQRNSVYWQTNERYRTDYLAAFFTMRYAPKPDATLPEPSSGKPCEAVHNSTQPMKLASAVGQDGKPSKTAAASLALNTVDQRKHGRELWLQHCAICHSSKQPDGFGLSFLRKEKGATWESQEAPTDNHYVLPMDFADWTAFKSSPAYGKYAGAIKLLASQTGALDGDPLSDNHPFWKDNFLSSEIRIPVTLVGTNSGRAMATNGLGDNVWDNFSSITYKQLPGVGAVGYFNPIAATEATYVAQAGGRGYYRPATHISLWATAPFLHNNTLGVYLDDPSVEGRLVQFTDGMRRMLWKDRRSSRSLVLSDSELDWLKASNTNGESKTPIDPAMVVARPGDLRGGISPAAVADPGFIYRLPQDSNIEFPAAYAHQLIQGIAGKCLTAILEFWLWIILVPLLLILAFKNRPRYLGIVLLGLAVLVAAGIALTGLGGGGSTVGALLMAASGLLEFSSAQWWILAILLAILGGIFILSGEGQGTARLLLALVLAGVVFALWKLTNLWWVGVIALLVAWIIASRAKPTLAGFSRGFFICLAIVTALGGYVANCFINGRTVVTIPIANKKIGPFDIKAGPIPRGTPINLMMSMDPESPSLPKALVSMVIATAEIKKKNLHGDEAWEVFRRVTGQPLMDASKCPDFVLDRGHLFGEVLDADPAKNDQAKEDLIAFLKTL